MTTQDKKKRSPLVRGVLVVASLVTAWHIFASFLWIAPYSANAREVVPGNALNSYMIPFFGQSWSVFAPEPINGSYRFEVRATLPDETGELIETEWINATDIELSMIQYNLFPPRAGIQAAQVASEQKGAYDNLTADHQVIVGLNYFEGDWEQRLADKMAEYGEPELVDAYIEEEHMATAYATQVAKAVHGDEVERVQYRVSRQNVIPFAERNNPEAEPPARVYVETGWRGLAHNPGQNDQAFADVFAKLYEREVK